MNESVKNVNETVEISFRNSIIRGTKFKSTSGKDYYGFLGIPYAKPPIGDLRFKPPVSMDHYPEIINATKPGNICTQKQTLNYPEYTVIGSEDCLYMDIFIPELPSKNRPLKPIIFNIHGGQFRMSLGQYENVPCPNTLIEYDIIFVNFTFRLHIFGFLNLGLKDCPGNTGLKDQLEALKWINSNIHHFGGDAGNITLMGTSSGAFSVHLHMLSPLSKGLFHKVILASGFASYFFISNEKAVEYGFKIGSHLGYEGKNKYELLTFLKSISAEKLLKALYSTRYRMDKHNKIMTELFGHLVFFPSIECIEEGAFLLDRPRNIWPKISTVPIITGICVHEGALFVRNKDATTKYVNFDYIKNIIETYIAEKLNVDEEAFSKIYDELEKFYFGEAKDDSDLFRGLLDFCSDIKLQEYYTIYDFMRKPEKDITYNYLFTYDGNLNFVKNALKSKFPIPIEGSCHSDESEYVQDYKLYGFSSNEHDRRVSRNICYMWSNFAKSGNPNGEELKIEWKPTTAKNPSYLRIDKDLSVVPGDMNQRNSIFWKYLAKKYSL